MSPSTLRIAAAAAFLTVASLSDARAQETFTSTDPLVTPAGAPETMGTVVKLDGVAGEASVYSVLARKHAGWLLGRGPYAFPHRSNVVVYVDGAAVGGKEVLRRLKVGEVAEVRRLDMIEATRRFGLDHGAGAILISTK